MHCYFACWPKCCSVIQGPRLQGYFEFIFNLIPHFSSTCLWCDLMLPVINHSKTQTSWIGFGSGLKHGIERGFTSLTWILFIRNGKWPTVELTLIFPSQANKHSRMANIRAPEFKCYFWLKLGLTAVKGRPIVYFFTIQGRDGCVSSNYL